MHQSCGTISRRGRSWASVEIEDFHMLRTMRILLLAGALGGLAASPALAQNARGMGGGGGHFSGGGGHFSGGGGGAFYPHTAGPGNMGGPGHMSMRGGGGPYQSYGGGGRQWARMHGGSDFNRMGDRRMRALAPANSRDFLGGDFRRDRFRDAMPGSTMAITSVSGTATAISSSSAMAGGMTSRGGTMTPPPIMTAAMAATSTPSGAPTGTAATTPPTTPS